MLNILKSILVFVAILATGFASISNQAARVGPYASPMPATCPVTFPFQSSADLIVLNLGQSETGNDPPVVLTLNSDYTVIGGGYNASNQMQTGTVVVVTGGAHNVQNYDGIIILRNVPVNQLTVFSSTGLFSPAMVEKALDKTATISQQLTETSSRALRFEEGETVDGTLNRTARSGKLLGFDSSGNISYSPGGGTGGTYTAGTGLQLAGNQFSVLPSQSLTSLTVTNPISGSLAGNADTATALATSRAINGVGFNGTANITIPAAAGTLTGSSLASGVTAAPGLLSTSIGTLNTMAIQPASSVNISGGAIAGASVTGLPAPSATSDAATKAYVDSISAGITPRSAVVAATTANITLSAPQTIDGTACIAGNRVLVKNQTTTSQNGIYDVAAGAWTRSSDSDTAAELKFGYYYFVSSGSTQGSTSWFIQTAPTTLGTDPVLFAQFSASTSFTAGTGLTLTGNQFSVNTSQNFTGGTITGGTYAGGAFNGIIGATTKSTGAFTTVQATGQITDFDKFMLSSNASFSTPQGPPSVTAGSFIQTESGTSASLNLFSAGGATSVDAAISGGAFAGKLNTPADSRVFSLFSHVYGGGSFTTLSYMRLGNTEAYTGATETPYWLVQHTSGSSALAWMFNDKLYFTNSFGPNSAIYPTSPHVSDPAANLYSDTTGYVKTDGVFQAIGGFSTTTTAAIRTTKTNFNSLINVRDFGALGDGVTNDTAAIASALSFAISDSGVLYFPSGVYRTSAITVAGVTGLSVVGDGIGRSVIKTLTASKVITFNTVDHLSVHGLTFDGNCTARTAGQQAVTFIGCSYFTFQNNEIINSGEFALYVSSASTSSDFKFIGNTIHACFADGINISNAARYLVQQNIIDGCDDDCIAAGNGPGVIIGNYCKPRNDLGTTWGRGIYVDDAFDILVEGNIVESTKQTGILVEKLTVRPTRISIVGNHVHGSGINSGHGICIYKSDNVSLLDNVVEDPVSGNTIEIADWQNLQIKGGVLTQRNAAFCRGIHCDESAGSWAASWDGLVVDGVSINMLGAGAAQCVYFNPAGSITMNTLAITNITSNQVNAGDYILVATARAGTIAKIGNNVKLQAANTVNPAASTGVFTVFNNN